MYLDNLTAGRGRKPQTSGITSSVTECLEEPSIEKTPNIHHKKMFLHIPINYQVSTMNSIPAVRPQTAHKA